MTIRSTFNTATAVHREFVADPFGMAARAERAMEAHNLLVGQFCADLLAGKEPLASMRGPSA